MQVELSYLAASEGGLVHVLARLSAQPPETTGERPPVNLALVIDRSSSMRGPRIAQALRAARQVVERLDERDRIALVAFDASARVVYGPVNVTALARTEMIDVIETMKTGIGTNLAAGWKKGVEVVASGFLRDSLSRVVLLTDGQPSVGITEAAKLADLARQMSGRGIATTCMGIGETFDDELLSEIARCGGGGFYYLQSPEAIPAAFGSELAGVFAVVATGAELKIMPDASVQSVELLHRIPSRPADDGLVVELGDLAAGPPRQVLFRLHRDAGTEATRVGTLMLTYRDRQGSPRDGHIVGIELPRLALTAHHHDLVLERLRLEVAAAVDEAWARRASGDRDQALAALRLVKRVALRARDENLAPLPAVDELLQEIQMAEEAVARSASEREKARRHLRERSHLTLLGHSTIRPLPEPDDEG